MTWIDREVSPEFWENMGKCDSVEELDRRFLEIPEEYRQLAYTIIQLAIAFKEVDCMVFRHLLYKVYKDLLDEHNIDIKLPHYWYVDGVMIPPEYIVKITNGIIGFRCDESSKEHCGMTKKECRFRED